MPLTIGVLVPSSNRTAERVAHELRNDLPGMDICIARVPYEGHPKTSYDFESFCQATLLLADARPDAVLWNATRGALLGFEPDRALCATITAIAGVPATTTSLGLLDRLKRSGWRRIGLVVQGNDEECDRLRSAFGAEGVGIHARWRLATTSGMNSAELLGTCVIPICSRSASRVFTRTLRGLPGLRG